MHMESRSECILNILYSVFKVQQDLYTLSLLRTVIPVPNILEVSPYTLGKLCNCMQNQCWKLKLYGAVGNFEKRYWKLLPTVR